MSKSISTDDLIKLALDLSASITHENRFLELLQHAVQVIPCDAVALLKKQGEVLIPLALRGLAPDTMGRRFSIADHPRWTPFAVHQYRSGFHPKAPYPIPTTDWSKAAKGICPSMPVWDYRSLLRTA